MSKIKVGVLGATGMVGQNYVTLLKNHPWFEVAYAAASPRSAGKTYRDAVANRWVMDSPMPESVQDLVVEDAGNVEAAKNACRFVFSAVEMGKQEIRDLENEYAKSNIPVVSNNSAHRHTADVPMLIPEINAGHLDILPVQRKNNGWESGFVVVKPNCSVQSYVIPLHALLEQGYTITRLIITTLQGLSGAGYPGVSSLDVIDNIVPLIKGEEEKSEIEPLKLFGHIEDDQIKYNDSIKISAHCNRVPVIDGHTACVSIEFGDRKPTREEILDIWTEYRPLSLELNLPSAPRPTIMYTHDNARPQPRKDRNAGNGMAITVGRLRECNVFDFRFVGLSHNTIRGAAGGSILSAELLKVKGFFD